MATLVEVFEDCSVGRYRKAVVSTTTKKKGSHVHHHEDSEHAVQLEFDDEGAPRILGEVHDAGDGTIVLEKVGERFIFYPECLSHFTKLKLLCLAQRFFFNFRTVK